MKKITLFIMLAALMVGSLDANAQRRRRRGGSSFELSTNLASLAYVTPTLYAGYNMSREMSLGLTVGYIATPFVSTVSSNGTTLEEVSDNFSGFLLAPEFRYYLNPNRTGNDGWYVGGYLRVRSASTPDSAFYAIVQDPNDPFNFEAVKYSMSYLTVAPGVLGGYLWQHKSGFQLSGFVGFGYAVYKNVEYSVDPEDLTQDVFNLALGFDFRGGACIGYRF